MIKTLMTNAVGNLCHKMVAGSHGLTEKKSYGFWYPIILLIKDVPCTLIEIHQENELQCT